MAVGRPERPIDPQAGPVQGFAYQLRQLRATAGAPSYRQLARRAHYSSTALSQAAAGEQLPSLSVTLAYVRACAGDPVEWEQRWRDVAAVVAGPDMDGQSPPYLGLAAFQPEDADRFFGREALVADLVQRLEQRRFLGVFGPSGCGKSSLLRAGVIPAMATERVVLMTPTAHPTAELTNRLTSAGGVDLLVVDQFEEVFTLCRDPDERVAFVEALRAGPARVVVAARADFLGHCAGIPGLVTELRDAQVLVGPMDIDELRRAIEQPAARQGLKVDPDLVSAALTEVHGQPGALPLLSHALVETWRRREKNRLTLAGYRAGGGLTGAIASTAERVFAELSLSAQTVTRGVLLRLVHIDDGVGDLRRRAALAEVLAIGDSDETARVVDRLVGARLVVVADGVVELAHEAVTRAWPRLQEWITHDQQALRVHRNLTTAAAGWLSVGRDTGALYRGVSLAAAREVAARPDWDVTSSALEREFLQTSIDHETAEHRSALRQARRMGYLVKALTALLAICAVVASVALVQRRTAIREQRAASSRQLALQAQDLSASWPDAAGRLAVAAYRTAPTGEARGALMSTAAYKPLRTVFREHRGRVRAVAFNSDGTLLASAGDDKTVLLREPRGGTPPVALRHHGGAVHAVAFHPRRPVLASAGDDQQVVLWDVASRAVARELPVPHGRVTCVAFSSDGRLFVAGTQDGTVILWDTERWIEVARLPQQVGEVYDIALSADAGVLAVAGRSGVLVADRVRGTSRLFHDHNGPVRSVALRRDGTALATGGDDYQVVVRDLAGDGEPAFLRRHVSAVCTVEFSPDGTRVLSASNDGSLRWWAPGGGWFTALINRSAAFFAAALSPDGTQLAAGGNESVSVWHQATPPFTGHTIPPEAVAFAADGRHFATGGPDHLIIAWERDGTPHATIRTDRPVTALAYQRDGFLVAADARGAITTWNVARRAAVRTLTGHQGEVTSLALHPAGRIAASGGHDHTVRLWDLTVEAPGRVLSGGHSGPVNAVAFDPTGRILISGGADGRILLWDTAHDQPPTTLADVGSAVKSIAFGAADNVMVTGDAAGNIVVWDIARRARLRSLPGQPGAIGSLAVTADGATVAAAGTDNVITLWDLASGRRTASLTGHNGPARAVAFAPRGHRFLASTGSDPRVVLWDLEPAEVIARICPRPDRCRR